MPLLSPSHPAPCHTLSHQKPSPVQADAHRVSNGRRDRKAVVVHVVFGIVCRLIPLQRSRVQRHGGLERCTPVGLCQLAGQTVTHRCSRRKQQHIIRHHGVRPIVHDDLLLQQPLVLLQHHPTVDPRQRGVAGPTSRLRMCLMSWSRFSASCCM